MTCFPSMTAETLSLTAFTSSPTLATLSSTSRTLSPTTLTLSSTACVAFKFCAMAIRASSCVSLSSLVSASSISVRPANLFRYFSEDISVGGTKFVQESLTCPALLDLLCRNPKDRKDLHHDLDHHIHHARSRWHLRVDFEASEKKFNTFKYVNESFLARRDVSSCLRVEALQRPT